MPIHIEDISALVQTINNQYQDENISVADVAAVIDGSLNVEVVTTEDGFDRLEDAWNQLLNQTGVKGHIFQTFDWQRLWWKHFSENHDLRILVVWKNNALIGIAPFFIEKETSLVFYNSLKLKLIGSPIAVRNMADGRGRYTVSDYQDVIIHPEYRKEVVNILLSYLEKIRHKVDRIMLDGLMENSAFLTYVLAEMEKKNWMISKNESRTCHQVLLPDTMEHYINECQGKGRYQLSNFRQKVTENESFEISQLQEEDEWDAAFEKFLRLYQKQAAPQILDNTSYAAFLHDIGKAFVKKKQMKIATVVDARRRCIAANFVFSFKDRIYDYQKAFDDGAGLSTYNPAGVLTYSLIEDAIASGEQRIELLRESEKDKPRFANHTIKNLRIVIPGLERKKNVA